ncbi:MAG: methylated-DNA--[protein]-cysteine S-methyltransferase [Alphaproteobacteria bacterium]|nr:methylated-DNA--[protein]-cysteine S-methyltransferase [Alphaproteobacteria bacterium]
MSQLSFHSPIGELTVSEEDGVLVSVDWGWGQDQSETTLLKKARDQLFAYFDGNLQDFNLPLKPVGSPFQNKVWAAMQEIPFGQALTYGQVAKKIGSGARAVGMACGANPIPIIIPCHRIVATTGLGGYSGDGGLATKQALLNLEGWQG